MADHNPQDLYLKLDETDYNDEQRKDAIVIIGLDGLSIYYSDQMKKILGMEKLPLENGFYKYIHPDDRDYIKQLIHDAIINKAVVNYSEVEVRILDKLGDTVWLSALPANYYDKDGNLIGFISSIRDITKKKKRELKREKLLNYYSKTLDQTKFFKDLIIHEVNNIMSVIQMSSEFLSDNITNKDKLTINTIDLIQQSIKRGSNLIDNVQKLSNLKDETEIVLKKIEILSYLNSTTQYIQQSYPERDIRIDIDAQNRTIQIMGNELLNDIFLNLLQNAVKYNKNSIVKIVIQISKLQIDDVPYIKMEFQDNGIGLSELQKNLIFLSIPKHMTSSCAGMGLGLYLVKRIVELFDGRIWVEDNDKSENSTGSNFILMFKEFMKETQ